MAETMCEDTCPIWGRFDIVTKERASEKGFNKFS